MPSGIRDGAFSLLAVRVGEKDHGPGNGIAGDAVHHLTANQLPSDPRRRHNQQAEDHPPTSGLWKTGKRRFQFPGLGWNPKNFFLTEAHRPQRFSRTDFPPPLQLSRPVNENGKLLPQHMLR